MRSICSVWAFLPESLEYLSSRHGAASLGQINALRQRLGAPAIAELPQRTAAAHKSGWRELVTRQGLRDTLSICAAFFATMITVFFAQSWTPKLLVNMGFTDSAGLSGSMIMNIAGAVGCVSVGYLAAHFPLKPIAIGMFLCFGVCVAALGVVPAEPTAIFLVLALIGFCLFGSIAVLYALVPTVFSPSCRATGTGLALGLGRLGAIAGPFLAGILIQAGWSRLEFCLLLSLPLLASVIFVWILGRRPAVEALPMPSATH
jgi:MFS family permease